jgi:hypothetical protein
VRSDAVIFDSRMSSLFNNGWRASCFPRQGALASSLCRLLYLASLINLTHSPHSISDPILKRRIAWLIGKWVSDMCSPANTPTIWVILLHLLHDRGPGSDCVVRLTAATAVRLCVDVGGTRQFRPFERLFTRVLRPSNSIQTFLRPSCNLPLPILCRF